MQAYESQYQEIWDSILHPENIKTIVEVGINEGEGTKKLKDRFPNAHIFALDVHVRHSDYSKPYDQIMAKLENIATVVVQTSPLPFEWGNPYDLCAIDIGSDPERNFENLKYWLKYKRPGGVLAMLIPKGDERRRERKKKFLELLHTTDLKYEEVYFNWFIFR